MNHISQKDELKDLKAIESKGTLTDAQKTRLAELEKAEGEDKGNKTA